MRALSLAPPSRPRAEGRRDRLAHTGKPFDAASIGSAAAPRAIMAELRAGMDGLLGGSCGGPTPLRKEDRSRFLKALDRELARLGREK